ncbi:hypothetical protein SDC9_46829 [bioreactor metagenome]|uniref:Uncharacterized protein n=1 Tax=bioreactor metagenome TaxID=1076179 RepID=A0A644WA33_9ZZZZ
MSKLKDKGYTKEQISQIMFLKQRNEYNNKIHTGDKVQLDKESIVGDPNWKRKDALYRVWCLEHFDVEMTAEVYKESRPDLWQLVEDDSEPKWLFHASELIVIKEYPA